MDDAPSDGLWLSLSDLAKERRVSKQALAKRVERLERLGHLATRPGPRGSKLVNAASFDRAAGLTVDAVRELNGKGASPEPVLPAPSTSPADPVLAREQARRAAYDADLKKLDLLERLGLILLTVDVLEAITESGATMVRALDRLPSKADDLLAAAQGGAAGARKFLRDLGIELRTAMGEAMKAAAEQSQGRPGRDLDDIEIPVGSENSRG